MNLAKLNLGKNEPPKPGKGFNKEINGWWNGLYRDKEEVKAREYPYFGLCWSKSLLVLFTEKRKGFNVFGGPFSVNEPMEFKTWCENQFVQVSESELLKLDKQ